jgi:hypothetical protein
LIAAPDAAGVSVDVNTKPSPPDIYDLMPPDIGPAQRRHNLERLAHLEIEGDERRARLAAVFGAAEAGPAG